MMLSRLMNFAPPRAEFMREMDRVFNTFLGHEPLAGTRPFPALNLWEDDQRVFAEAEVPGLSLNDLEINIQGNELSVKGQRRPVDGENVVYHRRERGTGQFSRFVTLPVEVDAERVEATLKNGVLTILMPKAERSRARKITVKTA